MQVLRERDGGERQRERERERERERDRDGERERLLGTKLQNRVSARVLYTTGLVILKCLFPDIIGTLYHGSSDSRVPRWPSSNECIGIEHSSSSLRKFAVRRDN
jgi:hypothetical protein